MQFGRSQTEVTEAEISNNKLWKPWLEGKRKRTSGARATQQKMEPWQVSLVGAGDMSEDADQAKGEGKSAFPLSSILQYSAWAFHWPDPSTPCDKEV